MSRVVAMEADDQRSPVRDPHWQDVEREIRNLDGKRSDTVILLLADESYMGISGGVEDRYVVTGFLLPAGSFILTSGEPLAGAEEIMVPGGGDEAPFAVHEIVSLDVALAAAAHFFQHGNLDPQLRWAARSIRNPGFTA